MAIKSQTVPKIKFRIHFKDMHQDCLRWDLDDTGTVVSCNLQTRIWKDSQVALPVLESLTPGRQVPFFTPNGEERLWKYPVTKIETL